MLRSVTQSLCCLGRGSTPSRPRVAVLRLLTLRASACFLVQTRQPTFPKTCMIDSRPLRQNVEQYDLYRAEEALREMGIKPGMSNLDSSTPPRSPARSPARSPQPQRQQVALFPLFICVQMHLGSSCPMPVCQLLRAYPMTIFSWTSSVVTCAQTYSWPRASTKPMTTSYSGCLLNCLVSLVTSCSSHNLLTAELRTHHAPITIAAIFVGSGRRRGGSRHGCGVGACAHVPVGRQGRACLRAHAVQQGLLQGRRRPRGYGFGRPRSHVLCSLYLVCAKTDRSFRVPYVWPASVACLVLCVMSLSQENDRSPRVQTRL